MLTDKERRMLNNRIWHALTSIRFWLRKLGISPKARRALWLSLADVELAEMNSLNKQETEK